MTDRLARKAAPVEYALTCAAGALRAS